MPPEYNVRSVERALAILDCFNYDHASFSLVELAKEIDLSASTTLRLVSTLEKKNYLYRNPARRITRVSESISATGTPVSASRESTVIRHCDLS